MNVQPAPETVLFIGCGARVPVVDGPGPTHAYMASSPACWAMFGEVCAREYSEPGYRRSGRQIVDAYAVQHPGVNERRAAQSVWVHLVSLCLVLEHGLPVEQAAGAMQRLLATQSRFEWLEPPAFALKTRALHLMRQDFELEAPVRAYPQDRINEEERCLASPQRSRARIASTPWSSTASA